MGDYTISMESLMFKKLIICLVFICSVVRAEETVTSDKMKRTVISVKYYSQMMGNVHQNPSRYSTVLTTISCNHPVKILKEISTDGKEFVLFGEDKWNLVSIGPYEGYVMTDYLTEKKNECFEEQYPKFF